MPSRRAAPLRCRAAAARRTIGPLLILVAAWLLAGCAEPREPLPDHGADLLAPINAPTLLAERSSIDAADPLFFGGFYHAEQPAGGRSKRWLGDRPGQVLIDLIDDAPRALDLVLELRASGRPDGSAARVVVLFDGAPLATLECSTAWDEHAVTVPAALTGFGPHLLELVPDPGRPAGADRGDGRRRPRSIALASIRIDPAGRTAEPPRLDEGGLHLPPGTAASWAFWVPRGGRLIARWDARPPAGGARLLVVDGEAAPHPLGDGNLDEHAGRCLQLRALNPPTAAAPATLADLLLTRPAVPPPPAAAAARSVLVIGELREGFAVTPSTTDPERALATLLSGREAAAFGWSLAPAFDLVAEDPAAAAEFLAAARPPVAVALALGGAPARPPAEELAARFPDLRVLMVDLPAGDDDFRSLGATLGPWRAPENARDLDLTATALAAAGRSPVGLDGIDLGPALAGAAPARVRPVAPVWLADRALAVVADRRWLLRDGDPRGAASLEEACALDYLRRRRRSLAWLER